MSQRLRDEGPRCKNGAWWWTRYPVGGALYFSKSGLPKGPQPLPEPQIAPRFEASVALWQVCGPLFWFQSGGGTPPKPVTATLAGGRERAL